jgi:mono/diheme cytochrome c family protein
VARLRLNRTFGGRDGFAFKENKVPGLRSSFVTNFSDTLARSAALGAILLGLAGSHVSVAAEPDAASRGAYLAGAAGCGQCHTDAEHGGRPYAGGRSLETRFGTIVTPNITRDRVTGIGNWRFDEFAAAMRWGIAPDNSQFLTAFPFPFYNRLTEGDLADLKAFLDTVPAVRRTNVVGSRKLFAAARNAIEVVALRFAGPWRPDVKRDAVWNRGAYLVAAVGRCGDCHTPRDWLGAPDSRRQLAGTAGSGGKGAPNITPDGDTGIGTWSEGDIETLLKDGQKPDFDFVGGAMGAIVDDTAKLDDADRHAIAVYLKSLIPIHSRTVRPHKKG